MLTIRFGQLTVEGLSPSKIHSLAGCSQTPSHFILSDSNYFMMTVTAKVFNGGILCSKDLWNISLTTLVPAAIA
jgi:hypothetical protein